MTSAPRFIDVSGLPTIAFLSRSPVFWAAAGVIMMEGTMFALLIASYYYARLGVDVWPPPGTHLMGVTLPTVEVVLLLLSVPPSYWSSEAAKKNDIPKARLHMMLNVVFAIAAIAVRAYEWHSFDFDWKANIEASIVWMMLCLHTFEIGADILLTLFLIAVSLTPRFSNTHRKGVDFDSITWYFLVAIWLPIYGTIFIAPYIIQAS